MTIDAETFLRRWARRKHETAKTPAAPADLPLDELPPVEALDFESDFAAFLRAKVDERVRRAALKKLFSDPRFNVMDGLDVYIDDYSKTEPIPPEMLAGLRQAQKILEWAKEDAEELRRRELEQAAAQQRIEPPASAGGQPAAAVKSEAAAPEPVPASSPSPGQTAKS